MEALLARTEEEVADEVDDPVVILVESSGSGESIEVALSDSEEVEGGAA
jgi:endonuclease V-like protein UPF0215 family